MSAATIYQALTELPAELKEEYDSLTETSIEQMLVLMAAIRDARQDLATFYDKIETEIVSTYSGRRLVVEGMGEVEIKRADKRTNWENERLTALVTSYALDERKLDEETGEYESGAQAVARVLSECSRPSWRLTPLRARGIDPDEYCEFEEGVRTVKLPPRQR